MKKLLTLVLALCLALSMTSFAAAEERLMALPPLPYRAAAKVLTPEMKQAIRKVLK